MPAEDLQQRRELVATLVKKERGRRRVRAGALAQDVGISTHTLSRIETGKHVSDATLSELGAWFGWDTFLDFVLSGNLDAANKVGKVDAGIREFAILKMRELADPDLYRKPYGGLQIDSQAM